MLHLKRPYTISIVAASALFCLCYLRGMIGYPYINILLIILAPAGYIYAETVTYSLAVFSWIFIYPLLTMALKAPSLNAAASIAVFNMLLALYLWYKKAAGSEAALRREELEKIERDRARLSEDRDRVVRFENGIKAKEAEIVNLYEITKKMSEHLKFEDIFRAFSQFLNENFTFRRCDLIVLKRVDERLQVDRAFSVRQKASDDDAEEKPVGSEKLIGLFSSGFRDIWLAKERDAVIFKALGIEEHGAETFLAMPLLSERKMVGVLAVEDLPKGDVERFVILGMQFALEIKKVLLYEMVELLAVTDSLTGLYVKMYFYERLKEELQRSERYKFEFAFIMVDIDNFKKCNDTYGHMVGDAVIRDMANLIRESVREIDIVGRYGGEEFAIALPETGYDSAFQVAERVRKKVEETVLRAYDEKLKLTISVGVAIYPHDALEISDIIDRADQALYVAKNSGKNVVRGYKK